MKKEIIVVIVLAVIIVVLLGVLFWPNNKPVNNNPPQNIEGIQVTSLALNQEVSSPLKITGSVNGDGWNGFEGQVGTVKLLDYKGNVLAQGILTAVGDWMKLPTNFETTLNFASNNPGPATLVFKNENASGEPVRDKTFTLPIKLSNNPTIQVDVFFGNMSLSATNEQDECLRVYPVHRYINKTTAVAKASIDALIAGPTAEEKAQGYFSSLPVGSKLNSISIVNGKAEADFNQTTESGGGSCSMASRVAEINKTLLQFPTITSVNLSIDGRTGDIFQP